MGERSPPGGAGVKMRKPPGRGGGWGVGGDFLGGGLGVIFGGVFLLYSGPKLRAFFSGAAGGDDWFYIL